MASVERIQPHAGLGEVVAERIRALISSGDLGPGQLLPPERELAAQFGVSRSIVREGLKLLAAQNIVVRRQGRGTHIASLSPEELIRPFRFMFDLSSPTYDHLHQARMVLEPPIAAMAAEHATEDELLALGALLEEEDRLFMPVNASGVSPSASERVRIDTGIHEWLARAACNPVLAHVMGMIRTLTNESRMHTVRVPGIESIVHRDHERLYRSIQARNPAAAEQAMREHLLNVHECAKSYVSLSPDDGHPSETTRK